MYHQVHTDVLLLFKNWTGKEASQEKLASSISDTVVFDKENPDRRDAYLVP